MDMDVNLMKKQDNCTLSAFVTTGKILLLPSLLLDIGITCCNEKRCQRCLDDCWDEVVYEQNDNDHDVDDLHYDIGEDDHDDSGDDGWDYDDDDDNHSDVKDLRCFCKLRILSFSCLGSTSFNSIVLFILIFILVSVVIFFLVMIFTLVIIIIISFMIIIILIWI